MPDLRYPTDPSLEFRLGGSGSCRVPLEVGWTVEHRLIRALRSRVSINLSGLEPFLRQRHRPLLGSTQWEMGGRLQLWRG